MAIAVRETNAGSSVLITISGRFDIHTHSEFRSSYKDKKTEVIYTVDLSETEFMDSSALGMLLSMRSHAGDNAAKVIISGCNDDLKKVFSITNSKDMFTFM